VAEAADSFADWLAAARTGSSEALGRVLEACRRYLLLVAEQDLDPALRAKGGPSDLVQQTFLEAQAAFGQFQGGTEDELLAWLRQLLRHNLIDFTRQYRGATKRDVGREIGLRDGAVRSNRAAEVRSDTPSPSGRAMAREQDAVLRQALERLPVDYRTVLRLRYDDGLAFDAIGARMGRSPEAARKLWARAIERLQQEMEASG
jgi:RNA polymerase sigma-70 factor (ECF subfamily)